jgi:hypothetical protein
LVAEKLKNPDPENPGSGSGRSSAVCVLLDCGALTAFRSVKLQEKHSSTLPSKLKPTSRVLPASARQIGRLLGRNSRAAARYIIELLDDSITAAKLKLRWAIRPQWDEQARQHEGCYILRIGTRNDEIAIASRRVPVQRARVRLTSRAPSAVLSCLQTLLVEEKQTIRGLVVFVLTDQSTTGLRAG